MAKPMGDWRREVADFFPQNYKYASKILILLIKYILHLGTPKNKITHEVKRMQNEFKNFSETNQ
jgi:hypothetical protein